MFISGTVFTAFGKKVGKRRWIFMVTGVFTLYYSFLKYRLGFSSEVPLLWIVNEKRRPLFFFMESQVSFVC